MRTIVKAAIKYRKEIYTGFDHGECFKQLEKKHHLTTLANVQQGFIDSDGHFVDREQAMFIALQANQLRYGTGKNNLISEDIHLDWLNKQAEQIARQAERIAKLEEANNQLIELKAKEMGEALSDAFNNFTVAVRNKMDKETILEYVRTHNQDKIKMLDGIKETLEDITDYLLKKGDITWAGSDKILDYIDCKIEQAKGINK